MLLAEAGNEPECAAERMWAGPGPSGRNGDKGVPPLGSDAIAMPVKETANGGGDTKAQPTPQRVGWRVFVAPEPGVKLAPDFVQRDGNDPPQGVRHLGHGLVAAPACGEPGIRHGMADDADSGGRRWHPGEDFQIWVGELSGSWQRSSAEDELLRRLCDLQQH